MIHVEGMGVIGSILAWRLFGLGIDFTWHDISAEHVAWRASTGAVYPAGPEETADLDRWYEWHERPPWGVGVTELASWCFTTKRPPHRSPEPFMTLDREPWKVSLKPSLHVNAPALVEATRKAFADRFVGPEPGSLVVVSHGFGARLNSVMWGWSRLVELSGIESTGTHRPALYHRPHRFFFAYAYPVPGRPHLWWAGSALVKQTEAKQVGEEQLARYYDRWQKTLAGLGVLAIADSETMQGWRPRGDDGDEVIEYEGRLLVKPHWHDGIRRAPSITDKILEAVA